MNYFSMEKRLESENCYTESLSENQIDHEITRLLVSIGIPLRIQGFVFAKECIKKAYFDQTCMFRVNSMIFEPIAAKFKTSNTNVERAIRHALSIACKQNKMCELVKFLNVKESFELLHPSVGEFIALSVECLRFLEK